MHRPLTVSSESLVDCWCLTLGRKETLLRSAVCNGNPVLGVEVALYSDPSPASPGRKPISASKASLDGVQVLVVLQLWRGTLHALFQVRGWRQTLSPLGGIKDEDILILVFSTAFKSILLVLKHFAHSSVIYFHLWKLLQSSNAYVFARIGLCFLTVAVTIIFLSPRVNQRHWRNHMRKS